MALDCVSCGAANFADSTACARCGGELVAANPMQARHSAPLRPVYTTGRIYRRGADIVAPLGAEIPFACVKCGRRSNICAYPFEYRRLPRRRVPRAVLKGLVVGVPVIVVATLVGIVARSLAWRLIRNALASDYVEVEIDIPLCDEHASRKNGLKTFFALASGLLFVWAFLDIGTLHKFDPSDLMAFSVKVLLALVCLSLTNVTWRPLRIRTIDGRNFMHLRGATEAYLRLLPQLRND